MRGVIGWAVLLASAIVGSETRAEMVPIAIDGLFEDWAGMEPVVVDPVGDGFGSVDFGRVWLADDAQRLFLRFELEEAVHLDERNQIHLYLDSDGDERTGLAVAGIGAEIDLHFGARRGTVFVSDGHRAVGPAELGLIASPTVSADGFEMALQKSRLRLGPEGLVRVALHVVGGDLAPDFGAADYTVGLGTAPLPKEDSVRPSENGFIRIVTYNVKRDAPWPDDSDRLGRQLRAVDPDIILLQEVYLTPLTEVLETVRAYLPESPGRRWEARRNHDCITLSRWPVAEEWAIDDNLAVLLDSGPWGTGELLVVNAHLPCCENDAGRELEVRHIHEFVRARVAEGALARGTPWLLAGDMNLVGDHRILDLLGSGGGDGEAAADWDGTSLASRVPLHLQERVAYTWRDSDDDYWPGQLDAFFYTDSVLDPGFAFILRTDGLFSDQRESAQVDSTDSFLSDHLLVSADFRFREASLPGPSVPFPNEHPDPVSLVVWPNPTTGRASILVRSEFAGSYSAELLDVRGRRVARPWGGSVDLPAGRWTRHEWSGTVDGGLRLPTGRYWLRLRMASTQSTPTQVTAQVVVTVLR